MATKALKSRLTPSFVDVFDRWLPIWGQGLILAAFVLMPLIVWSAPTFEISNQELRFTREAADYILKEFPPDKYYYVGVGRSPTLIIAYLQLQNPKQAGFLPATNVRHASVLEEFSQLEQALLKQHILRFLPSKEQLAGRTLLLIDFVDTGLGLHWVQEYVNGLVDLERPAESLGLLYQRAEFRDESVWYLLNHKYIFRATQQQLVFNSQHYDGFSAFTAAPIPFHNEYELSAVKPNPNYKILVGALKKMVNENPPFSCVELLKSGRDFLLSKFKTVKKQ